MGEAVCGPCLHCLAENAVTPGVYESMLRADASFTESSLVESVAAFAKMQKSGICAEDFCPLCWSEALGAAPTITLGCGHTLHAHCATEQVERTWPGGRIGFGWMECPVCRQDLEHELLDEPLKDWKKLRGRVKEMAVEQASEEHGSIHAVRVLSPLSLLSILRLFPA